MTDCDGTSCVNERKTLIVIVFTFIMMAAEIVYGYITNSMALLADGYHMGTHALAFVLTYVAYVLARRLSSSEKFPSGTDKIGTLAGYTSAIFLGITGIWIIIEAVMRLVSPLSIGFNEAIVVALIGLVVNAVCIWVMESGDECSEGCKHERHKDYNFMAAYYHILADILTSVLAILALLAGKYLHITFLDAFAGILGGMLIIRWSISLLKNTVKILVDMK